MSRWIRNLEDASARAADNRRVSPRYVSLKVHLQACRKYTGVAPEERQQAAESDYETMQGENLGRGLQLRTLKGYFGRSEDMSICYQSHDSLEIIGRNSEVVAVNVSLR